MIKGPGFNNPAFFVAIKIQKRLKQNRISNTLGMYLPTYLPTYLPLFCQQSLIGADHFKF